MLHLSPLKTLIVNNNISEINDLKSLIQKFPGDFNIHRITGDFYDLRHILSAEQFDCTFCDEKSFPINNIPQIEVNRFGCLILKDKNTLSFSSTPSYNIKPFYLESISHVSLSRLIKDLRTEIAEKKMQQFTSPIPGRRISFKQGRRHLLIAPENIIYAETAGNLTNIFYLESNEPKVLSVWIQLTELEAKLNSPLFFRTNRTYIINRKFFHELSSSGKIIKLAAFGMKWVFEVQLSERRLVEFKKWQF